MAQCILPPSPSRRNVIANFRTTRKNRQTMETKDTTILNIKGNIVDTLKNNSNDAITINVIQPKKDNPSILDNPVFTTFLFPLLVALITTLVVRLITRKSDKAELSKIETETEKNQEEISKIKSSYQPIILSSLQNIQNQLFQDKTNSLKELIKSKSEIFNVEQIYHEGDAIIEDTYDYYQNVYLGFSNVILENIKKNSLDNASLFPSNIREKFQNLVGLLYEVYEIQKREFSKKEQNMPSEVEGKLEIISKSFDELIDLIRNDLHFDNTFIHDFIKTYQK